MQTYRLLSGISSNEESGYLALLEKNEINRQKARKYNKIKWLKNCQTEKELDDRFRRGCPFEDEGGL